MTSGFSLRTVAVTAASMVANTIYCGDSRTGRDLTLFLVQVPLDTYIVFQACNSLFTDCQTKAT